MEFFGSRTPPLYCEMYMYGNETNTVIAAVNTPVKIAGGTVFDEATDGMFAHTDGRITYIGEPPIKIEVTSNIGVERATGSGTKNGVLAIFKNGVIINKTETPVVVVGPNGTSASPQGIINLVKDDYIEAWVENTTDAEDFLSQVLNVRIKQIL